MRYQWSDIWSLEISGDLWRSLEIGWDQILLTFLSAALASCYSLAVSCRYLAVKSPIVNRPLYGTLKWLLSLSWVGETRFCIFRASAAVLVWLVCDGVCCQDTQCCSLWMELWTPTDCKDHQGWSKIGNRNSPSPPVSGSQMLFLAVLIDGFVCRSFLEATVLSHLRISKCVESWTQALPDRYQCLRVPEQKMQKVWAGCHSH